MKRLERRVKQLESARCTDDDAALDLIRTGRFYDDLTNDERDLYCRYHRTEKSVLETIEMAVCGTLHFRLESRAFLQQKREEFKQNGGNFL